MTFPTVEFGTNYRLPPVPVSLPLAYHPQFEQLEPEVLTWLRPFIRGFFGESEDHAPKTENSLKERHTEWGAMVYPHCRPERFIAVEAAMHWLALLDDVFSTPKIQNDMAARAALLQRLNDIIDGATQPVMPVEQMVAAGWKLIAEHRPVNVQRRLAERTKEVLGNVADESSETVTEFEDIDSYLAYRRTNLFGLCLLTLTEWALGFDLQEYVESGRDLQTARALVIDHWTLVNDIFSFPKEIESGEKVNGIWILMGRQGLSLQAALDRLAAIAVETEARFIAIRDKILAGPLGSHPHVPDYLREIGHSIPGNLRFHRQSSRYHGFTRNLPDDDAGTTTPEPTVLYHRGTVHKPVVMSGFNPS
jgi:hypothetical protein